MFQRFRKLVFWLHLVAGVAAGLVILVMASTGVLLSFERQLTTAADGFEFSTSGEKLPPEALTASLQAAGLKGATGLTLSSDATKPAAFQFGKEKTVFVHPVTGEVLGEGGKKTRSFFKFVTGLHRWLAMAGPAQEAGKSITAAAALVFLFLIPSGLLLWIPKRWTRQGVKAITTIQPQLKGRARDWNWHNVLGIWFALPLLVITTTGVVMGYPWANGLLFKLAGETAPPAGGPPGGRGGPQGGREGQQGGRGGPQGERGGSQPGVSTTGWNQALAAVTANRSGWETIQFQFPAGKEIVFQVSNSHRGRPDLRESVTVDLGTAAIIKAEGFSQMSQGKRWRNWVRWIHTGEAGGWAGQLLAGLTAMAAATLVWTGLALSWRRWRRSRAKAKA
ncbi:PepSY-associated TM helix domain-containing protein [Luteolibacter soli]|uniref:PepSY-associated TM helix domain-containing protein n=1 Tax=Luteolibacter soli TaxID=3135280 RepID=A0ABU9B299_9BACT